MKNDCKTVLSISLISTRLGWYLYLGAKAYEPPFIVKSINDFIIKYL